MIGKGTQKIFRPLSDHDGIEIKFLASRWISFTMIKHDGNKDASKNQIS